MNRMPMIGYFSFTTTFVSITISLHSMHHLLTIIILMLSEMICLILYSIHGLSTIFNETFVVIFHCMLSVLYDWSSSFFVLVNHLKCWDVSTNPDELGLMTRSGSGRKTLLQLIIFLVAIAVDVRDIWSVNVHKKLFEI